MRKKGKTLEVFILLTVVSSFVLICFYVLSISKNIATDMRESVGAAFYLRPTQNAVFDEDGNVTYSEKDTSINQRVIDEILENENIQYCNAQNIGYVKSDVLYFTPGAGFNEESCMGQITSLHYSVLNSKFVDGDIMLESGRHITPEDSATIMISNVLASQSGLSVGDKIKLTHAQLEENNGIFYDGISEKTEFVDVQIIGIFDATQAIDGADIPTAGKMVNHIYCSHDVLCRLQEAETGVYCDEIAFYIQDPKRMNETIAEIKTIDEIDWGNYFVNTNDFQYQKIADGLDSIENIVYILLVCISIVSTTVLVLILTLRIRNRMQEAGVLVSIGISKREILVQFSIEVLVIAILAFGVSIMVTNILSWKIGSLVFGELNPLILVEQ
ncbi:ABC transporter permease, partial [Anaerosporobacter sp.]|uniref:ABC transporter permease n=1 Tax=Anaerosporobacter sp. TaxID=1872529 RepID=UPI00286F21C9